MTDQIDVIRTVPAQRARRLTGNVIQLLNRVPHLALQLFLHMRLIVEHARHSLDGNPCEVRHIFHFGRAARFDLSYVCLLIATVHQQFVRANFD